MTTEKMTFGFCPMCMQNVEHVRKFSSPFFWILDLFSLRILRLFRLGPWYCFQCERKTFYLKWSRRSAPTYHSDTSEVNFSPKSSSQPNSDSQSIGNYLRNEQSLVMKDKRSNRYSQKFRDSTVARILTGATTIAQVRQELNVSEQDIIGWIANVAVKRQERIDELVDALGAIRPDLPEQFRSALRTANANESHSDDVVVGRVLPK